MEKRYRRIYKLAGIAAFVDKTKEFDGCFAFCLRFSAPVMSILTPARRTDLPCSASRTRNRPNIPCTLPSGQTTRHSTFDRHIRLECSDALPPPPARGPRDAQAVPTPAGFGRILRILVRTLPPAQEDQTSTAGLTFQTNERIFAACSASGNAARLRSISHRPALPACVHRRRLPSGSAPPDARLEGFHWRPVVPVRAAIRCSRVSLTLRISETCSATIAQALH